MENLEEQGMTRVQFDIPLPSDSNVVDNCKGDPEFKELIATILSAQILIYVLKGETVEETKIRVQKEMNDLLYESKLQEGPDTIN